ncbi:MAG TPA: FAD-dependent oxidoreductase, partial [Macromonas sp.]|nr:FAD-dependent oxidoreductase [Macromonas sp.]
MGAQSGAKPWRVAVIGAGMAGLTAAYRLQQAGAQVEVFEREPVAGGRVATVRKNGFVIDTGAILLSAQYQRTLALVGELGLQAQLQ